MAANTNMQREPSNDPYPPETYVAYLQRADIMKAIGAQVTYAECPDAPYYKIADTGDDARSFLDTLSTVIQSGVNTLIWAGDAGEFRSTLPVYLNPTSKRRHLLMSTSQRLDLQLSRSRKNYRKGRIQRCHRVCCGFSV